jgi:hypothetical protein
VFVPGRDATPDLEYRVNQRDPWRGVGQLVEAVWDDDVPRPVWGRSRGEPRPALVPAWRQALGGLPVPTADELSLSRRVIRKEHGLDRYNNDPATVATLPALAAKLRDAAAAAGRPSDRYVLLELAGGVFARAGDLPAAYAAIDRMASAFATDPRDLRVTAVRAAAAAARTPDRARDLVGRATVLVEAACADDDYAAAVRCVTAAHGAAKAADDRQAAEAASALGFKVARARDDLERVRPALLDLAARPADPRANRAVGTYYGLVKGRWEVGLGPLARGDDPALAALAADDRAAPDDPAGRVRLADGWLAAAKRLWPANHGHARWAAARAGFWYGQAEPRLSGFPQVDARRKAAEAAALAARGP